MSIFDRPPPPLTHRLVPESRGNVATRRLHLLGGGQARPRPRLPRDDAAYEAALIGLRWRWSTRRFSRLLGHTPGFIAGDGMYQRMVEEGVKSNRLLGDYNQKGHAEL